MAGDMFKKVRDKAVRNAISKKIAHLVKKEDMPQKQAVAVAYSMQRAGRLTKTGHYKKKKD